MRKTLCSDDFLLVPKYSDIKSRKEVDLAVKLSDDIRLSSPIISAPMDTVTGKDMALALVREGVLPIIHRYNTVAQQSELVEYVMSQTKNIGVVGAAVGITGDYLERTEALLKSGARVICIDVAHGHHVAVERAIKTIKDNYNDVYVMAGNVATLEAFNDLSDWGADAIRCGIGGGSICSTRIQTGHGMPTMQTILDISQTDRDSLIIADGGIKNSGDMVKLLAAGADMVMVGRLLAGTNETPGDVILNTHGDVVKTYRGMASKSAQEDWRGRVSSIEGVASTVPYKGTGRDVIRELHVGIRSGLSYSGSRSVRELQARAEFIQQTVSGQVESSTHIGKA